MEGEKRFAVLIDADNVSVKYIKGILDEISNDGVATYKRIYGDWTKPNLNTWKGVLLENSILPIQQYSYTTGKSATDSAMIIDAMDILYSGNVDGFCLVSSDSDFTRLAARLRESGMVVVGMGERKTPPAFIAACHRFKYLEILTSNSEEKAPEKQESDRQEYDKQADIKRIKRGILSILDEISDEDQWVFMGDVGNILIKRYPDFDVRNYGFTKLTPFLKSLNIIDIYSTKSKDGKNRLVFIRPKASNASENKK